MGRKGACVGSFYCFCIGSHPANTLFWLRLLPVLQTRLCVKHSQRRVGASLPVSHFCLHHNGRKTKFQDDNLLRRQQDNSVISLTSQDSYLFR